MSNEDNVLPLPTPEVVSPQSALHLLDIAQAAARLNVTPRFIRRLIAQRRIAYLKIGKFIRFDPTDLETWIEAHRVEQNRYEAS